MSLNWEGRKDYYALLTLELFDHVCIAEGLQELVQCAVEDRDLGSGDNFFGKGSILTSSLGYKVIYIYGPSILDVKENIPNCIYDVGS